jgi:stage IV sporulation protein FB
MFETGFLQIARVRGAPVRIHWSVVLGALFFTGLRFEPTAWFAFLALVLVHELGHAAVVLACRLRVVGIDVLAFGGVCRWTGDSTPMQRAVIAWGGVLAQLLLLAATEGVVLATGAPTSSFGWELVSVFTMTNLWLAGVNLLPIPPLDGATAWTIFRAWKTRPRATKAATAGATKRDDRMASARRDVQELEAVERRPGGLSQADEARLQKLFDDATREGR